MKEKLNAAAELFRRRETWLKPSGISALFVGGLFVGICGLLIWLGEPAAGDKGSNLGSVLEAQAAMTAIFLAAMIFIVEAVQRREGLDDPLYELFLSKSWARWVFATSVWLLIGTALLYAFGPITGLIGELADARGDALGISSLVIAALLVLAFLLRALHVLRPEQYRESRREAVLSQVRSGAQSYAKSLDSEDEEVRRMLGRLNNPETQATRAIERVLDQAHRAVERAQLTEIREDMEILERICSTILDSLEKGGYDMPEIGTIDDRQWLGYGSLLSGMQRIMRTATNGTASESVLWAIFRADVQKAQTLLRTPYRLSENLSSGNELFVQVMLDSVQSDPQGFTRLDATERLIRHRTPQEEMLFDALRGALSRTDATSGDTRENRLARRVIAFIHSLATSAAQGGNAEQACGFFETLLQLTDDVILTSEEAPKYGEATRQTFRQAQLSAIGYGVGVGNHDFLDTAAYWLKLGETFETEQVRHLYTLMDQDVSQRNGRGSVTRLNLFSLSSRMYSQPPPIETREDIDRRETEGMIVGYMWLLGMIHESTGDLELPDTVRPEFARVWGIHRALLLSAFNRAGVGEGGSLWNWCNAAFASRGDDAID